MAGRAGWRVWVGYATLAGQIGLGGRARRDGMWGNGRLIRGKSSSSSAIGWGWKLEAVVSSLLGSVGGASALALGGLR